PAKSSSAQPNKSFWITLTELGRRFPNHRESMTSTSYPCSNRYGTSSEPMYPAPPATIILIKSTPSKILLFTNLRIVARGIERGVLRSQERDVLQRQIPNRFVRAHGLGVIHYCLTLSSDVDRSR